VIEIYLIAQLDSRLAFVSVTDSLLFDDCMLRENLSSPPSVSFSLSGCSTLVLRFSWPVLISSFRNLVDSLLSFSSGETNCANSSSSSWHGGGTCRHNTFCLILRRFSSLSSLHSVGRLPHVSSWTRRFQFARDILVLVVNKLVRSNVFWTSTAYVVSGGMSHCNGALLS
jgi:hypothetical protein